MYQNTSGYITSTPDGVTLDLRGRATDGASAIGVKISNRNDLTTAGAKICQFYKDDIVTPVSFVDLYGAYRAINSVWWRCRWLDAFAVSPGGSGATWTAPDSNTLGGYQLDAATEYLYFDARICDDWDGSSDIIVMVTFEVNVDNTGGDPADTVDLSLLCYYKGDAETANKTQTVEVAKTVGQSPQYKQFTTEFTVDYDAVSNVVDSDDIISFRLNLETDTSEVDNVIINFIGIRYRTAKVSMEIN